MASNLEDSAPSAVTRGYPPPSSLSTGVAKTSKKPRKPELAAAKSLPPNAFLPLSDFDKDRNNKKEQEIENVMKINDKFDETLRKSPSVPMGLRRHPRYSCDSLSDEEEEKQTARARRKSSIQQKKASLVSLASSVDSPFINLMAEVRLRKISTDSAISAQSMGHSSNRLVAEMSAAHWSVQKEVNMTELVEKTRSPPMILTPRNRPKNPRNLDPARWRKTAAKQVKNESSGSRIFANYQQDILERATTNESINVDHLLYNVQPSSPDVVARPFLATFNDKKGMKFIIRRKSWNDFLGQTPAVTLNKSSQTPDVDNDNDDDGDEEEQEEKGLPIAPFQRQSKVRATWSVGKKPEHFGVHFNTSENKVGSGTTTPQQGKKEKLKISFSRLSKLLGRGGAAKGE